MNLSRGECDAAAAFEAETDSIAALSDQLEAALAEHRHLLGAFGTIEIQIQEALERGEEPLRLVEELSETDRVLQALEEKLATKMAQAIKVLDAREAI